MTAKSVLFSLSFILAACTPKTNLIFNEGIPDSDTGLAVNEILICNAPKGVEWDLWGHFYNGAETPCRAVEGSMASIHHFIGSCFRIEPVAEADTVVLKYTEYIRKFDWAPKGFFIRLRKSGKVFPTPIKLNFQPSDTIPDITYKKAALSITDIIPAIKSVTLKEGFSEIDSVIKVTNPSVLPEAYKINLQNGTALIEASDTRGFLYAQTTLERLFENAGGKTLPEMTLEDWPDMSYRAQMLDVARLFFPIEELKKTVDVLARCKINTLALHLNDDENWRIEIEGLPELTEFGAFHDIPVRNDDGTYNLGNAMHPLKISRPGKDIFEGTSGFYSISEFKEFLRYAHSRGITVIPEIDIPGHCYSAVEAMKERERRKSDSSCRLVCPGDSSKYQSVQGYTGNVIDLSLPSTYNFLGKVFDSIIKMYKEAGVPLEEIAVGGDEVAEGAWLGSPACREEMEKMGFTRISQLRSLFIQRVNAMLRDRGIKISGYNEILENVSDEAFAEIRDNCGHLWVWKRINDKYAKVAYEYANKGIKVILANCTHTYLEISRNTSRSERGLGWAGALDERKTFSFLPFSIGRSCRFDKFNKPCDLTALDDCIPELKHPENITGIQAMLWTDNLWLTSDAFEEVFPKAYPLYERSWNARPAWEKSTNPVDPAFLEDFGRLYTIVTSREYPILDSLGLPHRKVLKEE